MTFVGKLNQNDLNNIVKPAYLKFKDMSYNINNAKTILMNYIINNCKTKNVSNPPTTIDGYDMNTCNDGIVMYLKNKKHIVYLFNIETMNVYIAEIRQPCVMTFSNTIDFDMLLMIYQDSGTPTYIKPTLLK